MKTKRYFKKNLYLKEYYKVFPKVIIVESLESIIEGYKSWLPHSTYKKLTTKGTDKPS